MDRSASHAQRPFRWGIAAVGIFLFFGALMAFVAGVTLAWPGTSLDGIWALNPRAYRQLAPFGKAIGLPFLLLGATMFVTATGWFRRCLWGWRLAVAIIAAQVCGDFVNLFVGHFMEGVIGVTIASALLVYLLSPNVRSVFEMPCVESRFVRRSKLLLPSSFGQLAGSRDRKVSLASSQSSKECHQ